MTDANLKGVKVAILVDDGFEQVELTEPRKALDQAGAETRIVSPKSERVRAWNFRDWGDKFPVDVALEQARPQDFDALHLPGGVMNPDALRMQPKAVEFVKAFFDAGNVYRESNDFDLGDVRAAAGLGLRLNTPFGPFRVEYGWKLDRQPGESAGEFFFSIGQAF